MSKRNDLITDLLVGLMEMPTSLVAPSQSLRRNFVDINKTISESTREMSNLWKEFYDEYGKLSDMHVVSSDIIETDDGITIKAEMPGFKKEDISISVEEDNLVISAETKSETETKDKYITKEIRSGKFTRVFSLEEYDKESISAKYENGILNISIKKNEEKKKDSKKIEIM